MPNTATESEDEASTELADTLLKREPREVNGASAGTWRPVSVVCADCRSIRRSVAGR